MALKGRKGGLPQLAERLLSFMFTQASTMESDAGEEDDEEAEREAGEGADGHNPPMFPPYKIELGCFFFVTGLELRLLAVVQLL